MKKLILLAVLAVSSTLSSRADVFTFTPNPSSLNNLDHNYFYTWGLNWTLPQGHTITSAQLSFNKIWDWRVEPDFLFIHLLDTAPLGVSTWVDYEGGGNFFASPLFNAIGIQHVKIAEWTDPYGGDPKKAHNLTFSFNQSQLTALQSFLNTPGGSGWGRFGFGFDPDCHYFNSGISFKVTTAPQGLRVPEAGSTLALLTFAVGGMHLYQRRQRRQRRQ